MTSISSTILSAYLKRDNKELTIEQNGNITIPLDGDNKPIVFARLEKGNNIYEPEISFIASALESLSDEQTKALKEDTVTGLQTTIKNRLSSLITLKETALNGTASGVAFQLYEGFGVIFRKDVIDLIKELSKEDRSALGKQGVRIAAYYVYHSEMIKPAAVELRAIFYRLYNGTVLDNSPIPPAGNVSMSVDDSADKIFYRKIGFPIFGKTAVRVDMVERVNSAVYDNAVEGYYTFNPALASVVGVGVEQIYQILHDLGFRYELKEAADSTKVADKKEEKSDSSDEAEEDDNRIRVYHLKKQMPRPVKRHKAKAHQKSKSKKNHKKPSKSGSYKSGPKKKSNEVDPDSPFAALKNLKLNNKS